MKISVFHKLPEKNQPHKCDEVITILDFLSLIKHGKWKDQVDSIRKEEDKKKRDVLKKSLPAVTISGTFIERKQNNLAEHSGFICVDIDGFSDKSPLLADPYTYALFRSASGNGLAVIVKINKEKHKESFRFLQNYYFNTWGVVVDPAPSNVASLRYVSFDPDLYLNEKSKQSKTQSDKPKAIRSLPVVLGDDIAAEMVRECVSLGINIAPTYSEYLTLGFALANGFGESGRSFFHSLCSTSEKYNSQQADKQYDICLKGAHRSGVTVGSFYWMLKQNGIHIPATNNKPVQIASIAKKSGRTKEGVVDQLVQINGMNPHQAESLVNEVFSRPDISLQTVAGDPEKLIESLMEWLKQNHPLRRNSITRIIEENGSEVKKERLNSIFLRARSIFNTPNVTYDLIERMIFSDFTPEFHPLREYIDRNRYRNSSGNISTLIRSIETDTNRAEMFIRKWLISIIAAIDGYPVRYVLALVGGQNTGKTEWFRRLLPGALQKYYAESKLDAGKDDEMLMCQKLIVMDDEMGGKSKQDEKRFKELTSKSIFSLRAPYGRNNEDFKRLALLCGTSNDTEVINDPTGNTRVLPVHVISVDHELYNAVDKDELFMELVRAYESGEGWQLNRDELSTLSESGREFEVTAYERELILNFYEIPEDQYSGEMMTATQIKDYIELHSKQRIMSMKRLGAELKSIFGKSTPKKASGKVLWQYYVKKIHKNEGDNSRAQPITNPYNLVDNETDMPF